MPLEYSFSYFGEVSHDGFDVALRHCQPFESQTQSYFNYQFAWPVKCNSHTCGPANRWGYLNYWVSCLFI